MNIQELVKNHGIDKIRALIPSRPLHVYAGMIAITSSSDNTVPILCKIDETNYKVDEGFKIGWVPIDDYAPKNPKNLFHDIVGFETHTFYQNDFESIVNSGQIKVYIEA
jgi:hypothetical protein